MMAPRELESVCTLCHRRPTKAYASLLTLQATQKTMGQLRKELKESKSQGLNVSQQSDDLVKVEQSYREILKVWHSFDMEKVLTMSHDLNRRIRNTFHEIELKKNIKK
ncbi:MAG: hypothetical protein HYY63_05805 [Elusimicrobia bacterium]|nr:hypothetical protein [Elusimicrobiota bacterium]